MRIILLFLFVLCIGGQNASAGNREKTRELARIQSAIREVTGTINELGNEKDALVSQLAELEKQYGEIAYTLDQLKKQGILKQQHLEKIRTDILEQKKKIWDQNKALQGQIRAAHAMGKGEKLKLLLNQQDPALSSRMVVYYDYLNKARLERLKDIENSLKVLNRLEQDKVIESKDLDKVLAQKKIEQQTLKNTKNERELLLVKLNKEYSSKKQQLNQLKESEQNLQKLIINLQKTIDDFPFEAGPAKPFHNLRGQLPWPIRGKLIKTFGSERADRRWDGVLIGSKEGTQVHAVTRGRVIYADWLRGYGLLIIIDHGMGYMTLYAFNQSLYKEVGEWVDPGEVIATVGKSGGRGKSGLYFGVRKKGKPVDPVKWCRKVRKGRVG